MSLTAQINGGKQFQPLPLNIPGSPASFGSFGENAALGSSFGSIGEIPSMSMPPGVNGHTSLGAGSPDARWHHMQFMQNTGQTQLGMSPSAAGMRPLLGVSPSHQFHVSGPHFQASPGSQHISSPGSQYVASPGNMELYYALMILPHAPPFVAFMNFTSLVLLATKDRTVLYSKCDFL
jgi:hypothetical protein